MVGIGFIRWVKMQKLLKQKTVSQQVTLKFYLSFLLFWDCRLLTCVLFRILLTKMFPQHNSKKHRAIKLSLRVAAATLGGLLYYFIISITGISIPCPFNLITGLKCPGCGITRMISSVLCFDFKSAFNFNPVLFCSLLPLSIVFLVQSVKYIRRGTTSYYKWQPALIWTVIFALIIFCIIRNITDIF